MRRTTLTLLVLVLCAGGAAAADDERPTLALALGGGAARGLTQIGVLQWLEDHRIPVEGVAGTSIGALVGGAWSSGLSAREIEDLVARADLDALFGWQAPHAARSIRDKRNARSLPGSVRLPFVGTPPAGVNAGHALWLLFSRMTFPVSDRDDFDRLPVPFRAVAVDLLDLERVVIGEGDLPAAMRASMSVPGLYLPATREGTLLIDGGPLNALPADVARDFGADRVLAVDVSPAVKSRAEIEGPEDVVIQSLTTPVRANIRRALDGTEILLRPKVDDVDPDDFDRVHELVARGYAAMDSLDEDLSRYAMSDEDYAAWSRSRAVPRAAATSVTLDFVEVAGDDPLRRGLVEDALDDLIGRPLDLDLVERRLTRLKADGRFHALHYLRARRGDATGLRVVGHPRVRDAELRMGLEVAALDVDDATLGVHARARVFDVITRDGQWQTDVEIGRRLHIESELYLPTVASGFVSSYGGYTRRDRDVHAGDATLGTLRRRALAGGVDLGLGHRLRTHEFRTGLVFERTWIDDAIGPFTGGAVDALTARALWTFDATDDASLPTAGVRGAVHGRHALNRDDTDDDLTQVDAGLAAWIPFGRHALVARAQTQRTLDRDAPPRARFGLGGPLDLATLRPDQRLASNVDRLALGWQHHLGTPTPTIDHRLLVLVASGAAYDHDVARRFTTELAVHWITTTPVGDLLVGVAGREDAVRGFLTFGRAVF